MEQEQNTHQYTSMYLENLLFSVPISSVKEIIQDQYINEVHHSPEYMCGVINLRGAIVTIIDPKVKLGMQETTEPRDKNIIIILHCNRKGEEYIGLLADRISEVHEVSESQFAGTPPHLENLKRKYMRGIYKLEDELMIVLEDKLLVND